MDELCEHTAANSDGKSLERSIKDISCRVRSINSSKLAASCFSFYPVLTDDPRLGSASQGQIKNVCIKWWISVYDNLIFSNYYITAYPDSVKKYLVFKDGRDTVPEYFRVSSVFPGDLWKQAFLSAQALRISTRSLRDSIWLKVNGL